MNPERTGSLRLLAPLGVAVLAALVLVVIATSLGGLGSEDDNGGRGRAAKERQSNDKFYIVEPGDSLTTISRKTGISVDKITRLNPELDPQALISGQRVKLTR